MCQLCGPFTERRGSQYLGAIRAITPICGCQNLSRRILKQPLKALRAYIKGLSPWKTGQLEPSCNVVRLHGEDAQELREEILASAVAEFKTRLSDLAFRRQWPPSAGVRFCTSYFKVSLLNAWVRENRLELGADVHVALGERAAESPRRAKKSLLSERFTSYGLTVSNWLPVHQWSRRDIFRKMRDWGIEPHPAYKAQGMADWQMYDEDAESGPRTSCKFCIYAGYEQCCHQAQAEANQGLLHRMVAFEQATGRTWWARRSATELLASLSN